VTNLLLQLLLLLLLPKPFTRLISYGGIQLLYIVLTKLPMLLLLLLLLQYFLLSFCNFLSFQARFWMEVYDGAKLFYLSGMGPSCADKPAAAILGA
jgi:hypothetical protein